MTTRELAREYGSKSNSTLDHHPKANPLVEGHTEADK